VVRSLSLVFATLLAGVGAPSGQTEGGSAVTIEMRAVHLRLTDDIALDVPFLRGQLISHAPGQPPVFDDGASYTLALESAEISIDQPSLNALVTRALSRAQSSMSDVRVQFDGQLLKQTGKLRRGVPVPFTVRSRVEPASDGRLRLRPVAMKAAGMPVSGLMKALGLEMDELIKLAPGAGVEVQDNDLLLSPGRILPPPEIRGDITSVVVRNGRLFQTYGSARQLAAARAAPHAPGHYVQFRGNRIRFGRLTMSDTDMRLIDADPKDPFDFYPQKYVAQLVAGYSKNTPSGALRVYMPDYDDVARRKVSLTPQRRGGE
jgi:hypothetical protein